ncbi:MAG TPA: CCA tRNA nucleotidyltransferase [bacterium]|nr:CCA tRNA nucleotidyltransferase [bacterium]HOL46649.1 CCA tRNA nucleotidyltransferase [bacterium]HPQ17780.1 CCA tRNA nucleotidyltransferase [bacterium]
MFQNKKYILAVKIIKKLQKKGFEAYFAGGCVRDFLLKKKFKDIDIATNATPDDVKKIFKKTIEVGKQFGVVKLIYYGNEYEITTFRKDINYFDGRHPEKIEFCGIEEDAKRRDFTINALYYDVNKNKVLDFVNGVADLKNKIIRAVGAPDERFQEDKLRIIRAIRFAIRLNFKIEKKTYQSIKKFANKIREVSFERIREELKLILTNKGADEAIRLISKTGILKEILPEVENLKGVKQPEEFHPEGDVFEHTLLMLKYMKKPTFTLAMGALLHDIGKPVTFKIEDRIRFNEHECVGAEIAEKICERFKLSNKEKEQIVSLVREHMKFMFVKEMRLAKLKRLLNMENFSEHLELHRLDCLASHKNLENYHFCKKKLKEFANEINIKKIRLITGDDLISLGFKPSPIFKTILNEIEDLTLEKKLTTKEEAINYVINKYNNFRN